MPVRASGEAYPVPHGGLVGELVGPAGHPAADDLVGVHAGSDLGLEVPLVDADLHPFVGHEVPHRMGGGHDAALPLQKVEELLRRAVLESQPGAVVELGAYVPGPEALQVPVAVEVDEDVGPIGRAHLHPRDHRDGVLVALDPPEGADQVMVRYRHPRAAGLGQPHQPVDVREGVGAAGVEMHVRHHLALLLQGLVIWSAVPDFQPRHLRQSDLQASSDSASTASASRVAIMPSSTTRSPWHRTVFTLRLFPE